MRSYRCRGCGEEKPAPSASGALPSICESCDPVKAERRTRRRGQVSSYSRVAGELAAAQARIEELEQIVRFDSLSQGRAGRIRYAGRDRVTVAVRKLAMANGRQGTIDALLNVAAECQAWAAALGAADPDVQTGALDG